MIDSFDSLNGTKFHAMQTSIIVDELAIAINADVMLFTFAMTVLANMPRLALRTLHSKL